MPRRRARAVDSKPLDETVRCAPPASQDARNEGVAASPLQLGPQLGMGGYADIYSATDRQLLRRVAVKVFRDDPDDAPTARQRFLEEAQITGQLDHPNIVPVHATGVDAEGRCFFSMKLVKGITFEDMMNQRLRQSPHDRIYRLLQVFLQVCGAASFAHARGVIHRDIKPDNVMVGAHGEVYLVDWGIALLRHATRPSEKDAFRTMEMTVDAVGEAEGTVVGTPGYMAPEQARGLTRLLDERADVFALGGLLYRMLTGRAPHRGATLEKELALARGGMVRPPQQVSRRQLPSPLCAIAMKALALHPADRYPSVVELRSDVERYLRGGWFDTRTYAAGEFIVKQGSTARSAFIIQRGRCEVLRKGPGTTLRRVRVLKKGDVFGETALFGSGARTASVRAVGPVLVGVVTKATLDGALDFGVAVGPFVRALARRFREVERRAEALEKRDSARTGAARR